MFRDTAILAGQGAFQPYFAYLPSRLDRAVDRAKAQLLARQNHAGYWLFELEADCTIPAEYILMMHFMAEIDAGLQTKLAHFLRSQQSADGSYPLFKGGAGDLSCSVKAYYAMKLSGDASDAPHMTKARHWILAHGGAAHANVFTRIRLAMFGQLPWRGVPFMPVEIMLLPSWFPFHLDKIAYWSRTVIVPLLILYTHKVQARNPNNIDIKELFVTPAGQEKHYFAHIKTPLGTAIWALDRIGLRLEPLIPAFVRRHATAQAQAWFMARLNGVDGLGGIFTAMVNAYEAMACLGIPADDPQRQIAKAAIERLLVVKDDSAYCQPCVSPIWDTGLAVLALQEIARNGHNPTLQTSLNKALVWLAGKQLHHEAGDWQRQRPDLPGGGWAFQFNNSHYPDVDDTAVVALAMHQANNPAFAKAIERVGVWIAGMQSRNGGYGAFDADNTHAYLNHIPFADHNALIDPPTADVSARCLLLLSKLVATHPEYRPVMQRCIGFLRKEQEADGCWLGRWGSNYIYGTWSVLTGFEGAGISPQDPCIRQAVSWLTSKQRTDGGWGEDTGSYHNTALRGEFTHSTAFHTALAVLALFAAGEGRSRAVELGVGFLLKKQQRDGFWHDDLFNAPGFPKVFYLKYHGYDKYFPLWALAKYRNQGDGSTNAKP
jgi:squalene-hopene/tetraprenyl-beta-curcumene cyclase